MVTMKALINGDETQVALQFIEPGDLTLVFTQTELQDFIGVLMDIRDRLQPAMERDDLSAPVN